MASGNHDSAYRVGDSVTVVIKSKPFIDVTLPPSSNEYRKVSCMKIAMYDSTEEENLIHNGEMTEVPNRPGWYFYRWQTTPDMKPGVYTLIGTSQVSIDGQIHSNRIVQQIRLLNDGIF